VAGTSPATGVRMQCIGKIVAMTAACWLLAGCAFGPLGGDLQSAREACNRAYPPRIGNYRPHADCVNAAIEAYALPNSPHPDLIRLQEEVRVALSDKVDRRRIAVHEGERRMAEADRLVTAAERDRAAGNEKAASRRIAAIEEMLR
jgi:hypothetical protein